MKSLTTAVALLLSLPSTAAYADGSSWKDVKVTDITIHTGAGAAGKGYVVVTFSSNGMRTPSCASGYPKNLVIDLEPKAGAFAAATLEQSMMLGSSVTVIGSGHCDVSPSMETLDSIQTHQPGPVLALQGLAS